MARTHQRATPGQPMSQLQRFLNQADQLSHDERQTVLRHAAFEILHRLAEDAREFDIPISYPDGPTWGYVLSTGIRRDLDTPADVADRMLDRPMDLATPGQISDVLGLPRRS
jgi:hypothetical protein